MPSTIVLLQRDHEASPHLRALIDAVPEFTVAAMAHTLIDAHALLQQVQPDMLVTDLWLQDGKVHNLLSLLRKRQGAKRPHVLVTVVSQDDAALVQALRAGADGYWVHARSPELLLSTLAQLARGESPMSPMIARQVLNYFDAGEQASAIAPKKPPTLTGIEREILQRVAKGYLIDEIAQQYKASVHSVALGIRHVYQKLQSDWQDADHLTPA